MNTEGLFYKIALSYAKRSLDFKGEALTKLGDGTYAEVYTDGNVAIKVTNDKHDAILSNRMVGEDAKNIVKTFKVFQVNQTFDYDDVFLIINELLTPVCDTFYSGVDGESNFVGSDFRNVEDRRLAAISDFVGTSNGIASEYNNGASVDEMMDEFLINRFNFTCSPEIFDEQSATDDIRNIVTECVEYGFRNCDLHKGNIGVDKDFRIKMLDIGHRSSDGKVPLMNEFNLQ